MIYINQTGQIYIDRAGYFRVGYMVKNESGEILMADSFDRCVVVKDVQGNPESLLFVIKQPKTLKQKFSAVMAILKG